MTSPAHSELQLKRRLPLKLRPARVADADFVRGLATRVFLAFGSYDEYLVEWLGTDGVRTEVAELDGESAGFVMLVVCDHPTSAYESLVDLLGIAVDPGFQGRGIGTALLSHALQLARDLPSSHPVTEVRLSVADGNSRAQRLFSRAGFRHRDVAGVYPAGQRALGMVKRL